MLISGNAPDLYPVETFFAILQLADGTRLEVPYEYPLKGEWGDMLSFEFTEPVLFNIPIAIDAIYLSIIEEKFYSIQTQFLSDAVQLYRNEEKSAVDINIVVGFAPYGFIVIWQRSIEKSAIIVTLRGKKINVSLDDFNPHGAEKSISEICKKYIEKNKDVEINLQQNGLPPRDLFDNYMKQFTYRYQVIFEQWSEDEEKWMKYDEGKDEVIPEFEYIEESLFDGTHDKLHDGGLMKYHEAGKPKKLSLKWRIKKSVFSAFFWFEDEESCTIFNKFYGQHADTKTDFIIHTDPINKKYELSLYRYGLKEPVIIPESAYQLIVFKSGFENYRSDNYNQPTGAWIW